MTYLIGLGNYLMGDDSIGLRLIEYIVDNDLDENFQAIELSGNALNLVSYLDERTKRILIIDTALMGKNAGEFTFLPYKNLVSQKENMNMSTHEDDVLKVLYLSEKMGYYLPEIMLMAIEPESVVMDVGLSKTLNSQFSTYIEQILLKMN